MSKIVLRELHKKNDSSIVDLSCNLDSVEKIYGGFFDSTTTTITQKTATVVSTISIFGPVIGATITQDGRATVS